MATLFRRSLGTLVPAALVMTAVFAAAAVFTMNRVYIDTSERALRESAEAMASLYARAREGGRGDDAFAGTRSGLRVTIVREDGAVTADTAADPAAMENHLFRPEIAAAFRGGVSSAHRRSSTVGTEQFYAAALVPGGPEGGPREVLRIAVELPSLAARLAPELGTVAAAVLAMLAVASAAAALWSRRVARPLSLLSDWAGALASREGDGVRARSPARAGEGSPREIRVLARALEDMAHELDRRVGEARDFGLERAAILDGMKEGVISLDGSLSLRLANPMARSLFRIGEGDAGKGLLELTRSTELEAAALRARDSGERAELELALREAGSERWFQVAAAPLPSETAVLPSDTAAPPESPGAPSETPGAPGVIIVLNDITRLRKLERVRKDFVANVSHELRTPIQLVKGFAEALAGGALDDRETAERFVGIIGRNAGRMERLVEDLLSLAYLERDGLDGLARERGAVAPVLASALEAVAEEAARKSMALTLDCPADLEADVNAGLLEQAVANLAANAVKYSPEGRPVLVRARAEGGELVIEVRDRGFGIPAGDLPRVFERFYRVDKARSREQGGTGLGLAIVRHIALAHGGSVSAESWEAEGSTFTLRLPLRARS